jgi:hypothetical protein
MKKYLLTIVSIFLLFSVSQAQSYYFGIKGGPTISIQKWGNSFSRSPLLRYHGVVFIESAPEDNQFALFAQLGYHVKGSQIKTFATTINTPSGPRNIPARSTPFLFKNLSLVLGGKQKFDIGGSDNKMYYLFGIRGDWTIDTQLRPEGIDDTFYYYYTYPFDIYVNKFVFGMTAGGGFEFPFSEFVGGLIEFTVNPDFTLQYNQPPFTNLINPNPNNPNNSNISERQIRTTTFEVTFGLRFLHRIEYIDTKLF